MYSRLQNRIVSHSSNYYYNILIRTLFYILYRQVRQPPYLLAVQPPHLLPTHSLQQQFTQVAHTTSAALLLLYNRGSGSRCRAAAEQPTSRGEQIYLHKYNVIQMTYITNSDGVIDYYIHRSYSEFDDGYGHLHIITDCLHARHIIQVSSIFNVGRFLMQLKCRQVPTHRL